LQNQGRNFLRYQLLYFRENAALAVYKKNTVCIYPAETYSQPKKKVSGFLAVAIIERKM
jgi:hypothetical protein